LLNEIAARVSGLEDGQNAQNSLLESLKARVFLIDEGVENVRKESVKGFSTQGEMLKQFHTSVVGKFDSKIVDARDGMTKRIKEGFDEQGEMLRQFHTSIVNRLDTKLTDVKDGMTRQLDETAKTIEKGEQRDREIMTALIEEKTELTETKVKVTKLENALAQPKPLLTSQSSPEEVKGIGPSTGNELRQMGITSVGELVLTDPKLIAEKTSTSEKGAEKLQGRALLAMVPGLEEKDVNLLDEIGVTSRKELANQDPVELGWKINEVFKVRIEEGRSLEADKPTIEKIYSWVKSARA
jgi:predicted flap endonuclease-1-like 5' DNA nuclease